MKNILRIFLALLMCFALMLAVTSCALEEESSEEAEEKEEEEEEEKEEEEKEEEEEENKESKASLEIINLEVFAYDEDGNRLTYNRQFFEVNGSVYYAINNMVVTGNWVIDGTAFVFDTNGAKLDTVLNAVFVECEGNTYYVINNTVVYNKIILNGAVYDFGTDGKMAIGQKDGYIYGTDGKLIANNLFITVNNYTYYLVNNTIVFGQQVINGAVYDFGADGKMVIGEKDGYIYGTDGKLIANNLFITVNNSTYYIINNTIILGQQVINGAVYNFGADGKMIVGEYDRWVYGSDGKLIANGTFITVNDAIYYIVNSMVVYGQQVINGMVYDFGTDGRMTIGEKDGFTYASDGTLIADGIFITVNNCTYYIVNNTAVMHTYLIIDSRLYYFADNGVRLEDTEFDGYRFGPEGYVLSDYELVSLNDVHYVIINNEIFLTTTFTGTIYESDGDRDPENNPLLSGVLVTLSFADLEFTAYTNDDGRFEFNDLPPISVSVVLTVYGYIDTSATINLDETTDVNLIMDRDVSNNLSGNVYIADADSNITNNSALSDATVTLERTSSTNPLRYETTTDSTGYYRFENLTAGMYNLVISKDGYVSIEQIVQVRYNETNVYNIALEAIPTPEENSYGYASGSITDARTGNKVAGLTIYIYNGINNIDGDFIEILTSDSNGSYTTSQLIPGNYTAYVVDERDLDNEDLRYGSVTIALKVFENTTISNQSTTVSNSVGLNIDGMRIVLTWGSTPGDLDSHITFGSNHVYYSQKSIGSVSLDVDDTTSYGPETITISSIGNYTYNYYIYNYSRSGTMSASQATVTIYFGGSATPAYTLRPPTGSGYTWNVFTYNAVTGEFVITNTLS